MKQDANPDAGVLLDAARKKLAPDKRTAVFDVKGSITENTLTLKGELQDTVLKQQLMTFLRNEVTYKIVDSVTTLPEPSLGTRTFGVVNVSVANIRTKPGHDQEMATQAILGTPLKLLKEQNGWYLVQTPDEYLGWTDDMIALFTRDEYEKWVTEPRIIITTTYTHSFSSVDTEGDVVSDLVAGNILKFVNTAGDFYLVEYPKGDRAFVHTEDALPMEQWLADASDTPDRIITTARRFMGVPYLWGGTSCKAMDCSGFTKTVYFLNGVMLPRDASQQALIGEPVSLDDNFEHLKKGDLLFFGRHTAEGERVTHVGIYVEAQRYIHESGRVRVNSLNPSDMDYSAYRRKTLLRATRIIGVGENRGVRRLASIPYYTSNEH